MAIVIETALGNCGISWGEQGVKRLSLPQESPDELIRRLGVEPVETMATRPPWVSQLAERVKGHLLGQLDTFLDVPLDFSELSQLDAAIYRALRLVPPGQTTTYGALARQLGKPGAARAVGRAMAHNPIPLIVPCHRVLAANGALGGFSAHGGGATKERLLALEGVKRAHQTDLFA